jgi:hypothetical protein
VTVPKLEEVFKVGGVPTYTFVPPNEYNALLVALRTPGRGIVIEGPSGIGKTTAVTKALDELGLSKRVLKLSARKQDDVALIKELPSMSDVGTVIIDDFHKLSDDMKSAIADFMKILADEERSDSKLIVLGINKAGESLIQFAHDLNNRLEVLSFDANPREKVEELLLKGEKELQVALNVRNTIVNEAHGSFYLAQMLARQCCLDAEILETQTRHISAEVSFEQIRGKVFDQLSRTFKERTERFARGPRFRREGRAPYLHLLFWLAGSDAWSLSCSRAARENPELRGSLTQVMEKGYLAALIEEDSELVSVLHFDPKTRNLTVEDPQYVYYIRNIGWSTFADEVGFLSTDFPSRYDFALSFAGADRAIANAISSGLTDAEFEVFYDENEQHRILARDVEDYLRPIYQSEASFVVVLLGPEYPKRIWTKFESDHFKDRFKSGAVIPVWFTNTPTSMFDDSKKVGGTTLDPTQDMTMQVAALVELLTKKISDHRVSGT